MPIYEFKCNECSNQFDELCAIGTITARCPKCGSTESKRQISSFGIGKKSSSSVASGTKCSSCHSHHCHSCH